MRSCMDRLLGHCASKKKLGLNVWIFKMRTHRSVVPHVALVVLAAIILPHQEDVGGGWMEG